VQFSVEIALQPKVAKTLKPAF